MRSVVRGHGWPPPGGSVAMPGDTDVVSISTWDWARAHDDAVRLGAFDVVGFIEEYLSAARGADQDYENDLW